MKDIIFFSIWFVSGLIAFITYLKYELTNKSLLRGDDIGFALFLGFFGPIGMVTAIAIYFNDTVVYERKDK